MKKQKQEPKQLKGWTPFTECPLEPFPPDHEIARAAGLAKVSPEEMLRVLLDIHKDTVYVNSRYQVNKRYYEWDNFPPVFSLSIKRLDKQRVGPERYRDFLRIKNELVGPMHEGFEVYPGMERNVDTANQYYMWVFADPNVRLPVGFQEGRMSETPEGTRSINAPFGEGDLAWQHLTREQPA